MIDGGMLSSSAERASLDINALSGDWEVESLPIAADQYKELIQNTYVNLRIPSDSLSIHCENILQTAVAYTTYVPRLTARVSDKYMLNMRNAECVSIRKEKIHAVVGLYNFVEPLSAQVANTERDQRLAEALRWNSEGLSFNVNDTSIWEYSDVLVGEAAGNIVHRVLGPIPSTTLFEKKDQNYYRLVLVSSRSIVAVDLIYPLSMSLENLQAKALPFIQALRYMREPVGSE
jgi:hypothetical protein